MMIRASFAFKQAIYFRQIWFFDSEDFHFWKCRRQICFLLHKKNQIKPCCLDDLMNRFSSIFFLFCYFNYFFSPLFALYENEKTTGTESSKDGSFIYTVFFSLKDKTKNFSHKIYVDFKASGYFDESMYLFFLNFVSLK